MGQAVGVVVADDTFGGQGKLANETVVRCAGAQQNA